MWRGLFYGEANTPEAPKRVTFWVYDTESDRVLFRSAPRERKNRNIAVDRRGRAHYDSGRSGLHRYDPATNREEELGVSFPGGGFLRASSDARRDGTLLLVTHEPPAVYLFDPEAVPGAAGLRRLASPAGYVADVALDPDESVAYIVPGAHGRPPQLAAAFPLQELDLRTGAIRTIAELGPLMARALGEERLWGTFSVSVGAHAGSGRRTIYLAANSGTESAFGKPALLAVHLP